MSNSAANIGMRRMRAWMLLTGALGLHVVDEALTGFLDLYNPLVLRMRDRLGWWPMPTFTFGVWLAGLALLVAVLFLLSPVIKRGGIFAIAVSWILAVIMFMNGLGHLAGSIYFERWLPGATSAPLLLVTSVLLARAVTFPGRPAAPRAPATG